LATPRLDPVALGLVVARNPVSALEDGHVEPLLGDAEPLLARHQLPGIRNRIALEVVAKAEVAQHLEEGVMPPRKANVFKVVVLAAARTHFCDVVGARVLPPLRARKRFP